MYGLDKNVKLDFLAGKELAQVSVGAYQVILRFAGDIEISIEGLSDLADGNGTTTHIHANSPQETARLLVLLKETVGKATNRGDGSVLLTFSNGYSLLITDSNKNFESYQISRPSNDDIVV